MFKNKYDLAQVVKQSLVKGSQDKQYPLKQHEFNSN